MSVVGYYMSEYACMVRTVTWHRVSTKKGYDDILLMESARNQTMIVGIKGDIF